MGGQWNFMEEELVEPDRQHSSMYTCLWINAPKEAYELPNHRFDGELPSYVKRPVMYRYLKEYHLKYGQAAKVKFNCKVENVTNTAKDKFSVTWVDTAQPDYPQMETFDYVVVAVGHFSVPNDPIFTNEEKFTGKIIHAHDYRDGRLYKDKRVLLVGGSYSAEDIALQCWKFGAKYSHITHKNPNRMGFQWPKGVVETETFLKDFDGNKVIFEDGSSEEYDYVIKCTGYIHHFPFMSEDILLKTENSFCPENLYQQCVLLKNPKVFYMGMANQALSMTIFQHQSFYIRDLISGKLTLPSQEEMQAHYEADRAENATFTHPFQMVRYQGRYANRLAELTGAVKNGDQCEILIEWIKTKLDDVTDYRNKQFNNFYTGNLSHKNKVNWFDDREP